MRQALKAAGLGEGARELADLVSAHGGDAVTPQAAHNWIRGKTTPRRRNLRALAKALRVAPEDFYADEPPGKGRLNETGESFAIGVQDRHAIDAFLSLPPEQRKPVRELIHFLAKAAAK
ncbi:helix-turn-helix domain-containing protein [Luteimonas huabeiensis]|uniref:helix-turn-helix domain-containing protein n=1 Tax=Luteimonas huabeiensis TaxID=1244513 RepID=UPI00136481A0|nr:helix-turn-helix transcriptional regulator [Luteimonas huabeiensis]